MTRKFSKTKSDKLSAAFTLIELLIVIAIIGVLSALITVGYNSAKVNSRDAKRISDIGALDTAARLMYEDTKKILTSACENNDFSVYDTALNSVFVPEYINTIPHDPKFPTSTNYDEQYLYVSTDASYAAQHGADDTCTSPYSFLGAHYYFFARLENSGSHYINLVQLLTPILC